LGLVVGSSLLSKAAQVSSLGGFLFPDFDNQNTHLFRHSHLGVTLPDNNNQEIKLDVSGIWSTSSVYHLMPLGEISVNTQ
jgi:hypothetical protein